MHNNVHTLGEGCDSEKHQNMLQINYEHMALCV